MFLFFDAIKLFLEVSLSILLAKTCDMQQRRLLQYIVEDDDLEIRKDLVFCEIEKWDLHYLLYSYGAKTKPNLALWSNSRKEKWNRNKTGKVDVCIRQNEIKLREKARVMVI